MTAIAPHTRPDTGHVCRRCSEPVIATSGAQDRRPKLLDPTPQPGGLYSLDGRGRAVRRPIFEMYRECRAEAMSYGGGYCPHVCAR